MPINYFSYFSDIEEYFVRKRRKNLLVSPLDWSLIETWKEKGIPLHIVLRGIDRSFENLRKTGKTAPSTLSYCHPAVMEAFQEYQESRIGARNDPDDKQGLDEDERGGVLRLLAGLRSSLRELESTANIGTAGARIEKLEAEFSKAEAWNPAELERELGSIAHTLAEDLKEELDGEILTNLEKEIKASLKLYRKRVSRDVYTQLFEKQVTLRVLDLFGLPEFSLMGI